MRALKNPTSEKVLELEKQGADIHQLESLISGRVGLKLLEAGEVDNGLLSVGQVIGLVRDIPTVKDLIDRTIKEAERVIANIAVSDTFKPLRKPSAATTQ
jgi:NAD(P)H-dependent flavin oxidoreductase YrpB (nitropropane dioxygenase family)